MDFSLFFDDVTTRHHSGESQHGFLLEAVRFADAHDFCAIWPPQQPVNALPGSAKPLADQLRATLGAAASRIAVRSASPVTPDGPLPPGSGIWIVATDNSDQFKTAGRVGTRVLTHLLGSSIESLAKDIALYRRMWAESGHSGLAYVTVVAPTLVDGGESLANEVVREAMREHLRQKSVLLREAAWDFPGFLQASEETGITIDQFLSMQSSSKFDELIQFSADRYAANSGLFGNQRRCLALVERLEKIGVDEIACLINFGWPPSIALQHLPALNELRLAWDSRTATGTNNSQNGGTAIGERRRVGIALSAANESRAPRHTETQQKMVALWKRLLDVPEVDLSDNFFDVGGHSLLAARVVSEIDRTFGASLSVKTLMVSSLSQIAAEVDRLAATGQNGDQWDTAATSESPKVRPLSSYFKNP
jgi:hypothetical protein